MLALSLISVKWILFGHCGRGGSFSLYLRCGSACTARAAQMGLSRVRVTCSCESARRVLPLPEGRSPHVLMRDQKPRLCSNGVYFRHAALYTPADASLAMSITAELASSCTVPLLITLVSTAVAGVACRSSFGIGTSIRHPLWDPPRPVCLSIACCCGRACLHQEAAVVVDDNRAFISDLAFKLDNGVLPVQ